MRHVMSFAVRVWAPTFVALMTAAVWSGCMDGGWGERTPDPTLGPAPDDDAIAESAAGDGDSETAGETGDAGETAENINCGEGAGNEIGVGAPCTQGGGECADELNCDIDLDPQGVGVCIKLMCAEDSECGAGATCCAVTGSPFDVCIANECLPPECGGAPADGDETDAEPDAETDAETDAEPEAPGEVDTESETEVEADEAEASPEADSDVETEAENPGDSDADLEAEAESELEAEAESEAEAGIHFDWESAGHDGVMNVYGPFTFQCR